MSTNSPSVFNRDKFLLSREVLTISEYDVFDEHGNPILYIERPAYFLRNLGAALVGVIAGITVAILLFMLVVCLEMTRLTSSEALLCTFFRVHGSRLVLVLRHFNADVMFDLT